MENNYKVIRKQQQVKQVLMILSEPFRRVFTFQAVICFHLPKRYWTKMTKKEKLLKTTEFRHKILYIYYTYILTYEYNND